jgi:hypothetical protein
MDRVVMEGLSALAAASPARPAAPKRRAGPGRPPGVKNGQGAKYKSTAARAASAATATPPAPMPPVPTPPIPTPPVPTPPAPTGENVVKRGRGRPRGVKNGQVRVWGGEDGAADAGYHCSFHIAAAQADWRLDVRCCVLCSPCPGAVARATSHEREEWTESGGRRQMRLHLQHTLDQLFVWWLTGNDLELYMAHVMLNRLPSQRMHSA